VELTILSVTTSPGFLLRLPTSQPQLSSFSQQVSQQSQGNLTPASTPKPSAPSPEPSSSASTPYPLTNVQVSAEQQQQQAAQPTLPGTFDPDQEQTVLVDKSDDTWAVTLSHRLNHSNTLSIYRPALASGYLLRRRGLSDAEGLASLAVNIIYSQARVPVDTILKDVLRTYRDLATLSRTRGIAHAQGNCPLPWHIATAIKGQEALSYIL
jgi:mediator of RNA polymerase II transcription subunit 13